MKVKKCVLFLLGYLFKSESKFTITDMTVKDYMQNDNRCTKIITNFLNKKEGYLKGHNQQNH